MNSSLLYHLSYAVTASAFAARSGAGSCGTWYWDSESHLDDLPDLTAAWAMDAVVLEFQCPNGVDYEVDARDKGVVKQVDDKQDVSTHRKTE